MIGFGGPGVTLSLLHLGNLFPGRENTTMSFITGTICLSFVIFPLFNLIWDSGNGAEYQLLFRLWGGLILLLALVSFWLWPDLPYPKYGGIIFREDSTCVDDNNDANDDEISLSHVNYHDGDTKASTQNTDVMSKLEDLSFREQARSGRFIRSQSFLLFLHFGATFMLHP